MVNYKAWTISNYIKKTGQLLQKTRLERKKGVRKKKTADKLVDIGKSYKNMRENDNCTIWGMEEAKHKQ